MSNRFMGRKVLIIGGTDSFVSSFARNLLSEKVEQERIFSHDQEKKDNLRSRFREPRFQLIIGDVRDRISSEGAMKT